MTDAEKGLILAACARSAELWAAGSEYPADRWFGAAIDMVGQRDFVDTDHEATR